MTFPERLRAYRLAASLSTNGLALRSGMSPSAVSRFEHAERTPTEESVNALAYGLGLPAIDRARLLLSAGIVPANVVQSAYLVDAIAGIIAAVETERPRGAVRAA